MKPYTENVMIPHCRGRRIFIQESITNVNQSMLCYKISVSIIKKTSRFHKKYKKESIVKIPILLVWQIERLIFSNCFLSFFPFEGKISSQFQEMPFIRTTINKFRQLRNLSESRFNFPSFNFNRSVKAEMGAESGRIESELVQGPGGLGKMYSLLLFPELAWHY